MTKPPYKHKTHTETESGRLERIDAVNIVIEGKEHVSVSITYPAYTIGNKNAMEYAIHAIVRKLMR